MRVCELQAILANCPAESAITLFPVIRVSHQDPTKADHIVDLRDGVEFDESASDVVAQTVDAVLAADADSEL